MLKTLFQVYVIKVGKGRRVGRGGLPFSSNTGLSSPSPLPSQCPPCAAKTLYENFETDFPRNKTAWPRSHSDLNIPRIGPPILLQQSRWNDVEYINRSQIHECGNWEGVRAVSFLGIHKSDFVCSVPFTLKACIAHRGKGGVSVPGHSSCLSLRLFPMNIIPYGEGNGQWCIIPQPLNQRVLYYRRPGFLALVGFCSSSPDLPWASLPVIACLAYWRESGEGRGEEPNHMTMRKPGPL